MIFENEAKVKGTFWWKKSQHKRDRSTSLWFPTCKILDGASREIIKHIDWQIGYDTLKQAQKRENGLMGEKTNL
jgi:hypothetical protein